MNYRTIDEAPKDGSIIVCYRYQDGVFFLNQFIDGQWLDKRTSMSTLWHPLSTPSIREILNGANKDIESFIDQKGAEKRTNGIGC